MKQLRYATALIAVLLAALALGACGDDDDDDGGNGGGDTAAAKIERDEANADTKITVGSKNFTEQKMLGEIYAQGLEAAGYTSTRSSTSATRRSRSRRSRSGEIDAYPEYTGTALLSFFGVKADEIPKDPATAFEDAKAGLRGRGAAWPTRRRRSRARTRSG